MPEKHYEFNDLNNPPLIEEHSQIKHKVLEFYLERYIKVLTANPRHEKLKLWLIDGFSGGGKYTTAIGNKPHDGSPLILLKTVDKMRLEIQATRQKYFDIEAKYFFVEKDKKAFNFLKGILSNEGYKNLDNIALINDLFIGAFPKIMSQIKNEKQKNPRCIFLLDQYGYKDVPFESLKVIFSAFPNTAEVLLTFSTEHLIQYISHDERFKKAMANAGLSDVINDKLIDIFINTPSHENKNARLFVEQLLARTIFEKSGAKFFNPFFITSAGSKWSFLLIHLSCHWKARDEMNKTLWELHNNLHHYGKAGLGNFSGNPEEFIKILGYDMFHNEKQVTLQYENEFNEKDSIRIIDALSEEIPEIIFDHQESQITVGKLLVENCNFTLANTDHFKNVLKKMIDEKIIRIFSSDFKHERFSMNSIEHSDIISFKQKNIFNYR
ncbi:MAG: three-Cys-motif partner protein TcmP [Methylococcales bacterium]